MGSASSCKSPVVALRPRTSPCARWARQGPAPGKLSHEHPTCQPHLWSLDWRGTGKGHEWVACLCPSPNPLPALITTPPSLLARAWPGCRQSVFLGLLEPAVGMTRAPVFHTTTPSLSPEAASLVPTPYWDPLQPHWVYPSVTEMVWESLPWGWDPRLVWCWIHAPQGAPEALCPHISWLKHAGALPRLETDLQSNPNPGERVTR